MHLSTFAWRGIGRQQKTTFFASGRHRGAAAARAAAAQNLGPNLGQNLGQKLGPKIGLKFEPKFAPNFSHQNGAGLGPGPSIFPGNNFEKCTPNRAWAQDPALFPSYFPCPPISLFGPPYWALWPPYWLPIGSLFGPGPLAPYWLPIHNGYAEHARRPQVVS